mgnify:CR=1 FL=1
MRSLEAEIAKYDFLNLDSDGGLDAKEIDEYDRWIIDNFVGLNSFRDKPNVRIFVKNILYTFLALKENYRQ